MKSLSALFIILLISSCKTPDKKEITNQELLTNNLAKDSIQPVLPEILSKFKSIRDFTINNDENEAYFTLQSPLNEVSIIMRLHKQNNTWSSPEIASFSGRYSDLEPYLSPDYLRLYFASNRPLSKDSTNTKDFDIWYVERTSLKSAWSEPINLGSPVNSKADEFYPAITNSKNIYFTAITEETGPGDDIFISKWENDTYIKPEQLSDSINTEGAEFNAYVSPDESYIIFSGWRRPDGVGSGDLYISKNVDGAWGQAKNLGRTLNSKQIDFCPFVNPKTQSLYFTSRRSGIKKPDSGFKDTNQLMRIINRFDDGSSRIYKTDFNLIIDKIKEAP